MKRLIIILLVCINITAADRYAVVLKPVINVSGTQLGERSYDALPHAGSSQEPYSACPRLHQLLYNEQVKILKEDPTEFCIEMSQFYRSDKGKKTAVYGWVNKNDLIEIISLDVQTHAALVSPLSYQKPLKTDLMHITLKEPWYCRACKTTFSAGTRFKLSKPYTDKDKALTAYAIQPYTKKLITVRIPITKCLTPATDKKKIHRIYVDLLQHWAHTPGIIPYVWGGCSLVAPLKQGPFKEIVIGTGTAFEYPHAKRLPVDGFDCSGLILRAAQTAGMPYFCKNSATVAADLKPILKVDDLQDGDLIWIPAHVMAVGSINDNTIIEARHYSHGYGKVHEIQLNALFKDIETYADLFAAIRNNKPLYRLNNKKEVVQTIREIRMLSIDSCWDNYL